MSNDNNFQKDPKLPFEQNGKNPFELPSDYFSSFEDKIKCKLDSENELSAYPLLSGIIKSNVFCVPDNYFSLTENRIEQAVELNLYTNLSAIRKQEHYELEDNYSNYLENSLKNKIELTEELKSYHALYELRKENMFFVPDVYFQDLSQNIKDRIHVVKAAHVSFIDRVLSIFFSRKLAFSLAMLIVSVFAVYIYRTSRENIESDNCQSIACLEKQDILNNKSFNDFDEEQLMDLVDVNDLSEQLHKEIQKTDSLQQEEFILDNVDTDQLLEEL